MCSIFRAIFLGLIATTVSILAPNVRPAMAQSDALLIKASFVYNYAKYYAPYAIQASAAYLPIDALNDTRTKLDPNGYGADINYTVQNVFIDEKIKERARKAFGAWQYQFGSDSYLGCYDPTDSDCQSALRNRGRLFTSGPAFQVWTRTRFPRTQRDVCTEVSIAFRGTAAGLGDWLSNFDRFGSPYDDYYHQLRRNIDGIISSIRNLDCYKRAKFKPQIVSTGHSLGGGLAQLAALANKPTGPRITKVFAFDPSPVTGARLVEPRLRTANAAGLTIDRIYQEGEVLSYARSFVQEYPSAKSGCNPVVRTVKVDALPSGSAVQLHGMAPLTAQMVQLSYNGDLPLAYQTPSSPPECGVRYRPPTDDDGAVVANARGRQMLFASVRKNRGYADRFVGQDPFAMEQSGSVIKLTQIRTPSMAMMSGGKLTRRGAAATAQLQNGGVAIEDASRSPL